MRSITILLLMLTTSLGAFPKVFPGQRGPHRVYVGPEMYYMKRKRASGSEQDGGIYGIRVQYDRIRRCSFYWGADALYAYGTINGRTGSGAPLKSDVTDSCIEARVGYTIGTNRWRRPYVTPYFGGGYFRSINQFKAPTAMSLRFDNRVNFVCVGFLSGFCLTPCLDVGFNFKTRYMVEGRSKVGNDPFFEDATLLIENRPHYSVEIPITYKISQCKRGFEAVIVPFFRFRHYGGRENFPFDFIDTKFQIFGSRFLLTYRF